MKQFDNAHDKPEEYEYDSLDKALHSFVGNLFSATTMVDTYLEKNTPRYAEWYPFAAPQNNEGKFKSANDLAKLYAPLPFSEKPPQ